MCSHNHNRRDPRRWRRAMVTALVIGAAAAILACNRSEGESVDQKRDMDVAVTAATADRKTVPVQLSAIGTVEAYATVSIKSRVSGELVGVHFKEGQEVQKGDLLFTIDPRPYEVALQEAQAQLLKNKAMADKADLDAKRYAELAGKNLVSADKYEQFRANAAALKATVEADKASIENVRLQLSFCYIHAPFTGRTGSLMVDAGSQVKANDDHGLVDLVQITPIYVNFSVPQQDLAHIRKFMAAGPLKVTVHIPGDRNQPEEGMLTFVDNRISSDTGTILLKGTFANTNRRLWPGQFVDVLLNLTERPEAIVVPSQAVQTGQNGTYVFVIKSDMTVESRPVVVGMTLGEESVIDSGLAAGEQVVTDGQLRLVPGSRVQIRPSDSKSSS
jgi:membrane fusion protein, multidrug efflux system